MLETTSDLGGQMQLAGRANQRQMELLNVLHWLRTADERSTSRVVARITRAKKALTDANVPFEVPVADERIVAGLAPSASEAYAPVALMEIHNYHLLPSRVVTC